ncbi:MAG: DUF115 domain-containing protein [Spirochaetaceae bacterium]|jgi:hypothetical protein|nr:DUF115 domain-containing protein [Spirochaetaceae bacterium]
MTQVDVYTKNMAALQRFFPDLAQKLSETAAEGLVIETAANGEPTARFDGRYLHSARDPVREALRLAAAASKTADTVAAGNDDETAFVLLGFGLGYTAAAAADLSPRSLIIVVEKRPGILRAAVECRDLSGLLAKRVIFVLGDDSAAINAALRAAPKKLSVIRNSALQAVDGEFYREVERNIENWRTKEMVNEATLRRFGKRWIRNQAANLEAIRDLPGVGLLAGQFDFPVLLLAAGPTLSKLKGKIAALKERCIIVAVDTALRFLMYEAAAPDFVVSVDPQYWNTRHIDRCLPEESVLIAESAVYPAVLRDRTALRTFLCGSLYPLGSFIEARTGAKGRLGAGGSVASTAWDFSASLISRAAAPSIFIAGLDLAFPDMATHYKGALFEEIANITANRFMPAETKSFHALQDGTPFFAKDADGNRVLTDTRLNLYASWFENRLANMNNYRNSRLSSGGLAIKGLETVKIEDVLALPPCRAAIKSRIEQVLDDIFQKWNGKTEAEARALRYKTAHNALVNGLEAATQTARSVLSEISAFERSNNFGDASKEAALLKKIGPLNASLLKSEIKSIAGFLLPAPGAAAPPDKFQQYLSSTRRIYTDMLDGLSFTRENVKHPLPSPLIGFRR